MRVAGLALALVVAAAPAAAQPRRPLPVTVVDVRGFYTPLGQDPLTAGDLLVAPSDLPGRGLGGAIGVHVYPLRGRTVSFGLGGEIVVARGHRTAEVEPDEVAPPPVNQRVRGLSGSISLNFGHRDGWSYVSGGMGPMSFGTYAGDAAPAVGPPVKMTINYGGGARWFAWRHVAFAVDIRFYQTRPEDAAPPYAGRQRQSLRVMSAGISIR